MSTNDVSVSNRPCPCGQGKVEVTATAPDHPWARDSQTSYEYDLRCPTCEERYVMVGSRLVDRREREAELAAMATYKAACDALVQAGAVDQIRQTFTVHLESLGTAASIHRYLQQHRLETHTLATFRRHWNADGAEGWLRYRIRPDNLAGYIALLGKPTGWEEQIAELQQLEAAITHSKTVRDYQS